MDGCLNADVCLPIIGPTPLHTHRVRHNRHTHTHTHTEKVRQTDRHWAGHREYHKKHLAYHLDHGLTDVSNTSRDPSLAGVGNIKDMLLSPQLRIWFVAEQSFISSHRIVSLILQKKSYFSLQNPYLSTILHHNFYISPSICFSLSLSLSVCLSQ